MKQSKILTLTLALWGALLVADETAPAPLQSCTIAAINPEGADFFGMLAAASPPVVGDKITLDFNQSTVTALDFESGNSIPIATYKIVLNKQASSTAHTFIYEGAYKSRTSNYTIVLTAASVTDNSTAYGHVQILRKRFQAGFGQLAGQMSLHEADFNCAAVVP